MDSAIIPDTIAWPLAGDALTQLMLRLNSKSGAINFLRNSLSNGRLAAQCRRFIVEIDDVPVSLEPPLSSDIRVISSRESAGLELTLYDGFWQEVYHNGDGANYVNWGESIFATSNGSPPLMSTTTKHSSHRSYAYRRRCVAYGVRLNRENLELLAAEQGFNFVMTQISSRPAADQKGTGIRHDWSCVQELQKCADAGRLSDIVGDLKGDNAPGRVVRALSDRLVGTEYPPSSATLYRKAKQLIRRNEERQRERLK